MPLITVQVTFKGSRIPKKRSAQIVSSHPSIVKKADGTTNLDNSLVGKQSQSERSDISNSSNDNKYGRTISLAAPESNANHFSSLFSALLK